MLQEPLGHFHLHLAVSGLATLVALHQAVFGLAMVGLAALHLGLHQLHQVHLGLAALHQAVFGLAALLDVL